ncbi:uncharacterized protein LOC132272050 [Cornus florida]|uniref:uncharacterized protein LOC132272050 n=1 Tax=Cornus florida TaxID=4283 RepID=UPI00289F2164|nr:uncharacterized protein LOC132272050 [Cornus florida]
MREVVMKEVIKLLDAGIIYPISDSKWRVDKTPHAIYYASKTLSDAQLNYTTTEKELLAVVYALDKFRSYLIGSKDKKGTDNVVADHLSQLLIENTSNFSPVHDSFLEEQLFQISHVSPPWFADIVNYLAVGKIPSQWSEQEKDQFFTQIKNFFWEDSELFKYYSDQIIRRCISEYDV